MRSPRSPLAHIADFAHVAPLALVAVVAVVASHATTACSRSEGGDADPHASGASSSSRTSSCDRVTGQSVCSEYSGAYLAQNEAVLSSACGKLSGAFVGAGCPNTSVLGSCTLATGEVRRFYGSGGAPYDAARAEAECAGPYRGKWAAFR
jgi:hypothetical protein